MQSSFGGDPDPRAPSPSLSVQQRLTTWRPSLLNAYAIVAAFSVYFCMYAFRKPFAAASFSGASPLNDDISLKTSFVIAQIIGYAFAKFLGIRVLPSLAPQRRPSMIVSLVVASWMALLFFALSEPALQTVFLFANGLCLGMIWGLVVGYLEGRRSSEFLLAGLSCSFILASGTVKDVGRFLMRSGISENWMPFCVGALFLPGLLGSVWLLKQLPGPTLLDEKERSPRSRMDHRARSSFLKAYALPLLLLLSVYFLLTAFRDYRDNFGVELFIELGYIDQAALFTSTELPVALGVLIVLSLLSLVQDSRRALALVFCVMSSGLILLSCATLLLESSQISGSTWMILVGLGSYLAYVPFGSVLFDRIMAHSRATGTAVFGIYLADSIGYLGSICVQLYSDLFTPSESRLDFFLGFTHLMAWVGAALLLCSGLMWLHVPSKSSTA